MTPTTPPLPPGFYIVTRGRARLTLPIADMTAAEIEREASRLTGEAARLFRKADSLRATLAHRKAAASAKA